KNACLVRADKVSERVLNMGGAGDPPTSVGDPPTGTSASNATGRPTPIAATCPPLPSSESPDGTGESPVLPKPHFSKAFSIHHRREPETARAHPQIRKAKALHQHLVNRHARQNHVGSVRGQAGDLFSLSQRQAPEPLALLADLFPGQPQGFNPF